MAGAIPIGEKFSDILEGLEDDILRILTRTLITEPIAAGIRGGLAGDESGAGGLEGIFNKVFGASIQGAGLLFGEEEEQTAATGASGEAAAAAASKLLGLGNAGDAAGDLLRGSLSEGALKAGVETLTQATASTVATTQLGDLAVSAGAAAAALKTRTAAAGTGGGGGAGGGLGLFEGFSGLFGGGGASAGGNFGAGGAGAQAGSGPGQFGSSGLGFGGAEGGGSSAAASPGAAGFAGPGFLALGTLAFLAGAAKFYSETGLNSFTKPLSGLKSGLSTGFGLPEFASGFIPKFSLFGFAEGGGVRGPGTGTSDSIPAFLSDGEFVVNSRMAQKHRSLLEAVNSGRSAGLRRWAEGGFVLPQIPDMRPAASAARRDEGGGAMGLRPIVAHFHVSDHGSFQRNMSQFRGELRELISRAEKRDD
jgi:hypothetical protein